MTIRLLYPSQEQRVILNAVKDPCNREPPMVTGILHCVQDDTLRWAGVQYPDSHYIYLKKGFIQSFICNYMTTAII